MPFLSFEAFAARAEAFDALVAQTDGIDVFCSSSDWILPANDALMPDRTSWIWEGEASFLTLARGIHEDGWSYLQPLESMWLLASPCVSGQPERGAKEIVEVLQAEDDWHVLMLAGMATDSPLLHAMVREMASTHRFYMGPVTRRFVADLAGGPDGYLGRRSRNFRKSLRTAVRRCEQAGIELECLDEVAPEAIEAVFERLMDIEARSWKGLQGEGVNEGPMRDFYAQMLPRLRTRGALRLLIARAGEQDVGFILGGTVGATYRGLQFSFAREVEGLALGNFMQWKQIQALMEDGITRYDLGTEVDYKRRWGEFGLETGLLTVAPM